MQQLPTTPAGMGLSVRPSEMSKQHGDTLRYMVPIDVCVSSFFFFFPFFFVRLLLLLYSKWHESILMAQRY